MSKLICGDAFEVLKTIPNNSIDLILTDPPYNLVNESNFTNMDRTGSDFGSWDVDFSQVGWLPDAERVLKKNGSLLIFNTFRNISPIIKIAEELKFVYKDPVRWIKTNPMPRNKERRYISDFETAFWFTKKGGKWTFNRQTDPYERPEFQCGLTSGKNRIHPTQKPLPLLEYLLKIHSNEGDVVLDPFMGSGSAGVASINLGREFIGIELDEEYFNKASEWIGRVEGKI